MANNPLCSSEDTDSIDNPFKLASPEPHWWSKLYVQVIIYISLGNELYLMGTSTYDVRFFGLHLTYLPALITFCSTYPPTLNYAVRFCQIPFQPLPDYYMQHVPDIISFKISYLLIIYVSKGQIILKCLFGVFNFFQKTNENTSHTKQNKKGQKNLRYPTKTKSFCRVPQIFLGLLILKRL